MFLNILTHIYELSVKRGNSHCIKNKFELMDKIKPLTNINNIITLDFKDLFYNIILTDVLSTINAVFKEYFSLNIINSLNIITFHLT